MYDFFVYKRNDIFLIVNCNVKYNPDLLREFNFLFYIRLKSKKRVKYKFYLHQNAFFLFDLKKTFENYEDFVKKVLQHT